MTEVSESGDHGGVSEGEQNRAEVEGVGREEAEGSRSSQPSDISKPKSLVRQLISHLVSLSIIGLGLAGAVLLHAGQSDPEKVEKASDSLPVEVSAISSHSGNLKIATDGEVSSKQQVQVLSQVAGEIVEKSDQCRVGKTVTKGDLLFRVNTKDYLLAKRKAEKEKQQAETRYKLAELEYQQAVSQVELDQQSLRLAQAHYQRTLQLKKQNAVSQIDLDNAEKSFLDSKTNLKRGTDRVGVLRNSVQQQKTQLELAVVAFEKAQLDLKRTEIRAPISGQIEKVELEKGGFVSAGAPVFSIQDDARLEVVSDLLFWEYQWLVQSTKKSADADKFSAMEAVVRFEVEGESYYWRARPTSFSRAGVDSGTRMVSLRLEVDKEGPLPPGFRPGNQTPDPNRRPPLMAGMFVEVIFFFPTPNPVWKIPQSAVRPGGFVWYVKDNQLAVTSVKIFQTVGKDVIVHCKDLLLDGKTRVVTSPLPNPIVGMPVKVITSNGKKE